jgi:hypothetical protein
MSDWEQDKRWADKFMPEIKAILGVHLIGEPPIEEDMERNTDLISLLMQPVRIGVRMRRKPKNGGDSWEKEFTLRAGRPSGAKTELRKIIEGWGDYFFYGWAGDGPALGHWILGDLKAFRYWFAVQMSKGSVPGAKRGNHDGSSTFRVFRWGDIPGFLVSMSKVGENRFGGKQEKTPKRDFPEN